LDPTDDPVWIFFDTHHRHILHLLKTSAETSTSRFRVAMDQFGYHHHPDYVGAATTTTTTTTAGTGTGEDVDSLVLLTEEMEFERLRTMDLKLGVQEGLLFESLPESIAEQIREQGLGNQVWSVMFELVRNLNEVVLSTLPGFWKVAKGYMEGKYQKVNLVISLSLSVSLSLVSGHQLS